MSDVLKDMGRTNHLLKKDRFNNISHWIVTFVLLGIVFCLIIFIVLNGMKNKHVVRVDTCTGQAQVITNAIEEVFPLEVEAHYVSCKLIEHWLGFSSDSVDEDFAKALNLMTESLQKKS